MSAVDLQRQIDELRRQLDYLTSLEMTGLFGTYTPTLDKTTNVTSSTAELSQYNRVGSMVNVTMRVSVTATGAGAVVLGITLPIASNFANLRECAGVAAAAGNVFGEIRADTTNDRATLAYTATAAGALAFYVTFGYQII